MPSSSPEELLPVLVADLADDDARGILDAAAVTGRKVWVPLEDAPVNASRHVLEVHVPSSVEPLFYIAEPLGPPTEDGFPLRIYAAETRAPESRRHPSDPNLPRDVVRGRRATTMALTESHTKDLSHVGPLPTEDRDDSLSGRALAGGKLLIEQLIGRGGVGAVYKARHRELRMAVAVKVLHESFQHDIDFCRRFYAEALAASRLDHPNITRVIDFGQEPDGQLYFAMEFLDGVELRAVLEQERTLAVPRMADLMMQVCAGLSHAHSRGIIHRDIKPENLVLVRGVDDDGKPIEGVKVCDFGIAQQRTLRSSEQGVIAGTPEYMSPEQCRGDELDARSDVYACGIVLYELATGQVPFTSERPQQLLNKHQFTPPLPPSKIRDGLDPRVERVILKALAKEPEDRYQNMRELRAELRAIVQASNVEPSPIPPSMRDLPGEASSREPLPRELVAQANAHAHPQAASPSTRSFPAQKPPPVPPPAGSSPGGAAGGVAAPDWLERGPIYNTTAGKSTPNAGPPLRHPTPPTGPGAEEVDNLAANTRAFLQRLEQIRDPRAFVQGAARLEPAVRSLAARGDVRMVWAVNTVMHGIALEGTQAPGSRADAARQLLRLFEDPSVLAQVAEQLLAGTDESRDFARRILTHAGVGGAYGLYGARVKLANDPNVRARFVTVLKDFGRKAWPVVRAALEKILATPNPHAGHLDLAEDLLLCVPSVGDESAGHIVVKYLRSTAPRVCRAATAALVTLWGERSKPLLLGMVNAKEDVVRIAGIAGLRQLRAIDEHIVPRLHAVLLRRVPASDELRAAAAVALANATPSARTAALSLLGQLMTPPRDAPLAKPGPAQGSQLTRDDAVSIAIARSLLHLGGTPYRGLVAERAERSSEPLRSELRKLLVGAAGA